MPTNNLGFFLSGLYGLSATRPPTPTSPVVYCGENTWVLEPQTAVMSSAENIHIPPGIPSESGPLYSDFVEQQVAKQRNNNYHSTSLINMVATSVNRTALHPGGVQYVSPTFLSFSLSPCPPSCRLVILGQGS